VRAAPSRADLVVACRVLEYYLRQLGHVEEGQLRASLVAAKGYLASAAIDLENS
jgi:hypothetical protein